MAKAKNNTQELVVHQFDGDVINQRDVDGYVSATQMCKVAGKKIAHYRVNESTKNYLEALSSDIGIPTSELIQTLKGGLGVQGTWVHPKVAIHLAQWLSAKFAVQVTNWVYDWMTAKAQPKLPDLIGGRIAKAQIVLYYTSGDVQTKEFTEDNINYTCAKVLPKSVVLNRDKVNQALDPVHEVLTSGMSLFADLNQSLKNREVLS